MCDIQVCNGSPTIYQSLDAILTRSGQSVSCTAIPKVQCIVPRAPNCEKVEGPILNEFQPDPPGVDPSLMTFELRGSPHQPFTGFLTAIDGSLNAIGRIQEVQSVSGTFDENGILVVNVNDFGNTAYTMVLSSQQGGSRNSDLGEIGNSPNGVRSLFGTIYDSIGVPIQTSDEKLLYDGPNGGTLLRARGVPFSLVFRDSCTLEWYVTIPGTASIYDSSGTALSQDGFNVPDVHTPTFGTTNPTRRS